VISAERSWRFPVSDSPPASSFSGVRFFRMDSRFCFRLSAGSGERDEEFFQDGEHAFLVPLEVFLGRGLRT